MAKDTLTVRDDRTGKEYVMPVKDGSVQSNLFSKIKTSDSDPGLLTYDPGFTDTASCRSAITYLDGDKGILRYRGYPIEELAEKKSYLEVAYLLVHGELPTPNEYAEWVRNINARSWVYENMKTFISGFNYDAHPMGVLVSTLAAFSTFYPDAKKVHDTSSRDLQTYRLIGKVPTLAAFAYRHSLGRPYIDPSVDLGYTENFLTMLFRPSLTVKYVPDPVVAKALDVLFVLHADHEQNCSTNVMRSIASSLSDPFSCAAGAAAALYGPSHGGANEQVVRMLEEIGSVDKVPALIQEVKAGKRRLMGFGHRVYKSYDPRARIIKKEADKVFEVLGKNPLLDIALELERVALSDEYFISRKLYPNVDFYSGLIYQTLGFPIGGYPVLFAIPRMSGWVSQWREQMADPELKIARPRQVYTGPPERHLT
ncbi:MAG: citrate synthase [Thermoplasmata archaeon]